MANSNYANGYWAELTRGIQNISVRPEYKYIAVLFIVSKLFLTAIGVISRIFLSPLLNIEYKWEYSKYLWLDIWGIWDTGWYLEIARNWYPYFENFDLNILGQTVINFFPLYPALTGLAGTIVNNYFLGGIIVSNIALVVSCVYLYKLIALDHDNITAKRSIKYLFLAPAVFILSAALTESLFMMLIILCFYYARIGKWHYVGIFGYFLALTKSLGLLIIIPMFYEYFRQKDFKFQRVGMSVVWPILIPLGLFTFSLYNHYLTGDWLAFAHSQQVAWGHEATGPIRAITDGLFSPDKNQLINTVYALGFIASLFYFFNKKYLSYWLMGGLLIGVHMVSGHAMNSMFRYTVIIFPIYIMLAELSRNKIFNISATALLIIIQAVLMALWVVGVKIIV